MILPKNKIPIKYFIFTKVLVRLIVQWNYVKMGSMKNTGLPIWFRTFARMPFSKASWLDSKFKWKFMDVIVSIGQENFHCIIYCLVWVILWSLGYWIKTISDFEILMFGYIRTTVNHKIEPPHTTLNVRENYFN